MASFREWFFRAEMARSRELFAPRGAENQARRLRCESLEDRSMLAAMSIVFDYTYDTSNFFDTQLKKDLLNLAATEFTSRLSDDLAAITPGGGNTWSAVFTNPANNTVQSADNLTIAANTIKIYVGARDLGGNTLGEGGYGGYSANGTQAWLDLVKARGQIGALSPVPTDFGPWGGSLAFDSQGTNWFFSPSTAGILNTQSDFLTVAIHEIGHMLGFGTAPSFQALSTSGSFIGASAKAHYDAGGNIPLAPDRGHWAEGTVDGVAETSMDPSITNGLRKAYTEVDFGALADLGWTVLNDAPVLDNSGDTRLFDIGPDPATNTGMLITTLLSTGANGNPISDPDAFAMRGIAITGADSTHGDWQYSTTPAPTWQPMGTPAPNSSLLLSADVYTRIRFVPNAGFSGTLGAGITFKAWDQSSGNNGVSLNTSPGGGASAFSSASEVAAVTIIGGNQAPTDVSLSPASIAEGAANGAVVGTLFSVDPNAGNTFTYSLINNAGGRFALNGNQIVVANGALLDFETGASQPITVTTIDQGGLAFTKTITITVTNQNEVRGRFVFYNHSKFDGNNAFANALDDAAIATDKTALLPGVTASAANYTSYSRGINGIMVDLEHVPATLSAGDFEFRIGNTFTLSNVAPAPTSVTVRTGAGVGGSDRVTITWADGAIIKQWLQVTTKTSANLLKADVFYFGNAIGEANDSAANAQVTTNDATLARNGARGFDNPAPITSKVDFNRDGLVNAVDEILARNNSTNAGNALELLTFPTPPPSTNSSSALVSSSLPVVSTPSNGSSTSSASSSSPSSSTSTTLDARAVAAAMANYEADRPLVAATRLAPSATRSARAAVASGPISLRGTLSSRGR